MPVVAPGDARLFAAHWIEAWNAHDLERILEHYAETIEFSSPLVVTIAGEPSGTLRGKPALRAYWARGLALLPDLRFELLDVLAGVDCLTLYYRGHRGPVAETFHLDEARKVTRSLACYRA